MEINAANLGALFTAYTAAFNEGLNGYPTADIQRWMAEVPSTTTTEGMPMSALLGRFAEIVDEVPKTDIGAWMLKLTNKPWGRVVQVPRDVIADDQYSIYKISIAQLGEMAASWPWILAMQALDQGFTTPAWLDGEPTFSDEHVWPAKGEVASAMFSNLFTYPLDVNSFSIARRDFNNMKGPDGYPLHIHADTLMCGENTRSVAERILMVETILGGQNPLYHCMDLQVDPEISGNHWFIGQTKTRVKPFVFLNREAPEFTAMLALDNPDVFYKEEFAFKGRRRCIVGCLAPWLVFGSTGDGAKATDQGLYPVVNFGLEVESTTTAAA